MFILFIIQKQLNSLLCHIVLVTDVWLPLRRLIADINHPAIKVSVDLRVCICSRCLHIQSDKFFMGVTFQLTTLLHYDFASWQLGYFMTASILQMYIYKATKCVILSLTPDKYLWYKRSALKFIGARCLRSRNNEFKNLTNLSPNVGRTADWCLFFFFYNFAKSNIHTLNNSLFVPVPSPPSLTVAIN